MSNSQRPLLKWESVEGSAHQVLAPGNMLASKKPLLHIEHETDHEDGHWSIELLGAELRQRHEGSLADVNEVKVFAESQLKEAVKKVISLFPQLGVVEIVVTEQQLTANAEEVVKKQLCLKETFRQLAHQIP
jgi:hypothetical protein